MSIIDNLKTVAEVLYKAGQTDLYKQIMELQVELMDLIIKNRELALENQELKQVFNTRLSLEVKQGLYWNKANNDGPFCTRCWDVDQKLVRVQKWDETYICPECKTTYLQEGDNQNNSVPFTGFFD